MESENQPHTYTSPIAPPTPTGETSQTEASYIKKPNRSRFIAGIVFISFIGILGVFGVVLAINKTPSDTEKQDDISIPFVDPFETISIEAQAGIVIDLSTQEILYAKNASTSLPLASLTKLMTAYTALSHAPNILSITIDPEDIFLEGDQGLLVGEVWRLDDLLDFSLVTSSNDGMSAVAHAIGKLKLQSPYREENRRHFISLMNQTAQNLGLESMRFNNETGLDVAGQAGGYASAYDMAHLVGLVAEKFPDAVARTRDKEFSITSVTGFLHVARNTNLAATAIPSLLASKTGFTDLAGGNLAIVFNSGLNHPVALVVLGSSIEGRFDDVENLVGATYEYFQNK